MSRTGARCDRPESGGGRLRLVPVLPRQCLLRHPALLAPALALVAVMFFAALFFAAVGPFGADASASTSASQLQDEYLGSAPSSSIAGPERPARADDLGFWPHRQARGPNAAAASEAPISVSGTGYISGFVNDIQTNDLIEGVEIDVFDAETGEWLFDYSTYTDENGAYSISGLPNISVYVATYSYPLNYIDQWFGGIDVPGNWNAEGAVAIDLAANPTRTYINFRLSPGCVISGTVSNSSGTKLADVEVDAYDTDSGIHYGYRVYRHQRRLLHHRHPAGDVLRRHLQRQRLHRRVVQQRGLPRQSRRDRGHAGRSGLWC